MSHAKNVVIRPARSLRGSVRLPGDKSISHRYAMLGGIAEGDTKLQVPSSFLDCGNSGSTIRMLSGILAGQNFTCELRGDESLSRRPMARIITPLEMMGAKFESGEGGRP